MTTSDSGVASFGFDVAMHGDYCIVGAPFGSSSQNAYIYHNNGTSWNLYQVLYGTGTVAYFGWSVSIFGNYGVVGAPSDGSVSQGFF